MSGAPVAGPLAGLTVLDLSSVVLGPMCGQYLGDMGADVIKVEPPAGDITRGIGVRRSARMGSLFLSNNRNKRSVVLDLKRADGLAAVLRLARRSDVLLHSMRSNAAQRLGISYESLAVVNPGIVYCQVTGFGDDGPYGGLPAYDDIIQALSGMAMLQTVVAGEPRYFPSAIADKVTAVHAAYAIAGALLHRERTGKGQHVVVPMMETMVAFNLQEHLGGAAFEPVLDRMGYPPYRQAVRRPFKTRDGYLCVLPYTDVHWRNFLMIFGRADLADDPDYVTVAGRQRNLERVFAAVQAVLADRTSMQCQALLEGSDIPHAPINDLEDLLDDPHLVGIGFWKELGDIEGPVRLPGVPIRMSASPPGIRRLPPRLGEHTVEVLREYGFDETEIHRIIGSTPAGADRPDDLSIAAGHHVE